jgi:oxygen-independent coproporphyrinogen-3 oxidase
VDRARQALPWDGVEEVTFECEPGTLTEAKVEAIRGIGVTRLSLGVENFDDAILAENGRAHVSKEIHRCWPWVRRAGFRQVNVDLIAGMVGERWESWRETVRKTIDLAPDSVTIYQMELPYNTVYSRGILHDGEAVPVADWETKRAWHAWAFEQLEQSGYRVSSAYTVVRPGPADGFVYRDSVWHGCDLLGTGVASFSHVSGVHFQNTSSWNDYVARVVAGRLPLERAWPAAPDERLTRELILQLKLGRVETGYFRDKFGSDILEDFAPAWARLRERGFLEVEGGGHVRLTRAGLLRVDSLLPEFYAERYRGARYT